MHVLVALFVVGPVYVLALRRIVTPGAPRPGPRLLASACAGLTGIAGWLSPASCVDAVRCPRARHAGGPLAYAVTAAPGQGGAVDIRAGFSCGSARRAVATTPFTRR